MSGKGKQTVRKSGGKPSAKQANTKVKESSKPKEIAVPTPTTTSVTVTASLETPESKELAVSFPLIKTSDNAKVLPRYTAILGRSEEEGICMEDLDMLQLELEALLSAAALRIRALKGEVGALNQSDEKKEKKSKSSSGKPLSPGKRGGGKIQDERSVKKSKDISGRAVEVSQPPLPIKFTKVKSLPPTPAFQASTSALPDLDIIEAPISDIPVSMAPKNDTPNKFWASVEPYCSEISTVDVQVLKDLVQAHESLSSNLTIPPLGKHYSMIWLQEEVNEEVVASAGDKKKRDMPESASLIKKVEKSRSETAAAGPLTQRLVCALMEENLMPSKDSIDDKDAKDGENITPSRLNVSNGLSLANAANLELRVRKELQEHGLLDPDEVTREGDDEILTELKKCQEELKRVSQHNIQALNRLLALSSEEMARQDLRRKLNVVDMQVVEAYKKIMLAKYRKKPLSKKDKEPAWKALKERDAIIRQLEAAGGAYAQK